MATPPVPPVPNPNKMPTPMPGGAPMPGQPMGAMPMPGMPRPMPGGPGGAVPPGAVAQKATVDEEGGEEEEYQQRSFWQIPFVQDVLPFVTSLVIHLGILGLGWLTYETVKVVMEASKEPVIIPSEVMVDNAEVGGIPHPGLGGDETRDAAQDKIKDVPQESSGIAEKLSPTLVMQQQGGGAGDDNDPTIAIGASSGAFGKGSGAGSGTGDKMGGGTGDGSGALAPFGVPGGGGGIGPKSPFMGVSGNAMKVVYLCDSSGSMMTKFDTLRQELQKAVDGLRPVQAFDIIFFSEDSYIAYDKQLMQAVPENKRKAYEFLEKTFCRGSSDPIPGLRAAFATNPQLIYMLTDGDFPNNNAVIEEIRKLNQGRQQKVKINTIAFGDRGEDYEKMLKQVADENGGMFKFVTDQDLK